ncbi:hypothetical protein L202_02452 [Cryptococcus amylolentus CBS 6039]|uniref:HAT C-terminal dimerisation domain-containing protein n=1 Tax=Cryptococcus amylolentus CBS 6039 TaxID=1295533 RepID=A0A1E3I0X3_9TREE|nr:hypothetical protein L202_02452 [Cryptococcus amylolentus CBS 6039]ODN82158.1 hypothetical protein L202_02452 [Cryptococcus amylolentus CBS 6039]
MRKPMRPLLTLHTPAPQCKETGGRKPAAATAGAATSQTAGAKMTLLNLPHEMTRQYACIPSDLVKGELTSHGQRAYEDCESWQIQSELSCSHSQGDAYYGMVPIHRPLVISVHGMVESEPVDREFVVEGRLICPMWPSILLRGQVSLHETPRVSHSQTPRVSSTQLSSFMEAATQPERKHLVEKPSKIGRSWLRQVPYLETLRLSNHEIAAGLHYRLLTPPTPLSAPPAPKRYDEFAIAKRSTHTSDDCESCPQARYYTSFLAEAHYTGWNETALVEQFKDGLKPDILHAVNMSQGGLFPDTVSSFAAVETPLTETQRKIKELQKASLASRGSGKLSDEFDRYRSFFEEDDSLSLLAATPGKIEPDFVLQWWKRNEFAFPIISGIARDFLAIPASSVPSERLFLYAKLADTEKRRCMSQNAATFQQSMAKVTALTRLRGSGSWLL